LSFVDDRGKEMLLGACIARWAPTSWAPARPSIGNGCRAHVAASHEISHHESADACHLLHSGESEVVETGAVCGEVNPISYAH